jgi:predicted acyltransferase (DUF342 family)
MFVPQKNSGQALLAVVLILAVVLLLGGATLTLASTSKHLTLWQEERAQAYYIADAGIEMYLAALKQQPDDPRAITVPGAYAGGSLELTVNEVRTTPAGTEVFLEATGYFGKAVQRIKTGVRVSRTLDFTHGVWTASPPEAPSQFGNKVDIYSNVRANGVLSAGNNVRFKESVWAGGLELWNKSEIAGNIWSDGNVTIKNNGKPTGDIYVRGKLEIGNKAQVGGSVWATDGVTVANDLQLGGGIESGGGVSIGNNTTLTGGIRANGPVTLGSNVLVQDAVRAGGDVKLEDKAQVKGDVWSLGDVFLGANTRIDGDVHANGEITKMKNATVGGEEFEHQNNYFYFEVDPPVEPLPFPELDEDWYQAHAVETYLGNQQWHLAGDAWEGVHLVDGDLTVSGTYSGYATIYVTGDIEVDGDLRAADNNSALLLITPENVWVRGNSRVDAFFYAGGRLILNTKARLYGGLIARTVEVRNNVEIHHRPEMYDASLKAHTVRVEMLYWQQA